LGESPKLDLIDDLLRIAERDFDATFKHGAVVDDKAQKTSGMAGLFPLRRSGLPSRNRW
jgi:hypothetical protein